MRRKKLSKDEEKTCFWKVSFWKKTLFWKKAPSDVCVQMPTDDFHGGPVSPVDQWVIFFGIETYYLLNVDGGMGILISSQGALLPECKCSILREPGM
uniref:Uncharacterized protein n=1 Tax=Arundo donax TaxID=35708 RepID=A0A0A9GGK8_ARUDO